MRLEGAQFIAADRATVWAALNDPAILKASLPGCQSFDATGENSYAAVIKQKIGPVSATFNSHIELVEIDAPNSYRIVGEGKGGAAGFAKGDAAVALTDVEGGTELGYGVEVKIGGKIAQLGSRLIDGFAKKLSEQFFARFKEQVEGPQNETEPSADITAEAAVEAVEEPPVEIAQPMEAAADAQAEHPASEKKPFWKKLFG